MIIIGFPGIGKTTLVTECGVKYGIIDLESSMFRPSATEDRPSCWVKQYVNVACDLHRVGFTVFVSSHEAVRNEVCGRANKNDILVIAPDQSLKEDWLKRLDERVKSSTTPEIKSKNQRAYDSMMKIYDSATADIKSFCDSNGIKIALIREIDYSLLHILSHYNIIKEILKMGKTETVIPITVYVHTNEEITKELVEELVKDIDIRLKSTSGKQYLECCNYEPMDYVFEVDTLNETRILKHDKDQK